MLRVKKITRVLIYISVLFLTGCKKFVETDPPKNQLVADLVFSNDETANAAIDGIYVRMMNGIGFASGDIASITFMGGLSSDELKNYSISDQYLIQFYNNSLTPSNYYIAAEFWNEAYQYIYTANAILEKIDAANAVSQKTRDQIKGEAKFVRAFCYFYLLNAFGDVPLNLSIDYRINAKSLRSSSTQIYSQLIADLKEAEDLMYSDYQFSSGQRIRPNKWAAAALLARIYLYSGDWANAEIVSGDIINNSTLFQLEPELNNVFLKDSREAIWQLLPVQPGYNTNEGRWFVLNDVPTLVALSDQFINSFETGDNRRKNWVDSFSTLSDTYYYPYKYKMQTSSTLSEYSIVFRLAEQILIRAESRAQQNKIGEALEDLNLIRNRAGLPDVETTDKNSLLQYVLQERKAELFTEWGHRWFDLKRTGQADAILSPVKTSWQSSDVLYPIPIAELQNNINMTQNPGY